MLNNLIDSYISKEALTDLYNKFKGKKVEFRFCNIKFIGTVCGYSYTKDKCYLIISAPYGVEYGGLRKRDIVELGNIDSINNDVNLATFHYVYEFKLLS